MKKIFLFLTTIGVFSLSSCEGPEGPPGPAGYSAESEVFEVNTTFTPGNNYSQIYALNPNILWTDNILVYELYDVQDGFDTWALLPQIYYFPEGQAQYNYNFSYDQFTLFIDADFDRSLLPANFTQNKVFRIVVVPGMEFKESVDIQNYDAVIEALKIQGKPIKQMDIKQ